MRSDPARHPVVTATVANIESRMNLRRDVLMVGGVTERRREQGGSFRAESNRARGREQSWILRARARGLGLERRSGLD
jgi:hypothetical protein